MKKENIFLVMLPLSVFSVLLYLGEVNDIKLSDFELFSDQKNSVVSQKDNNSKTNVLSNKNAHSSEFEKSLDKYEKIYEEESTAFENKIQGQWGEYKSSSATQWVSYVDQGKIRRSVDYDTGEVSVDFLMNNEQLVDGSTKRKLEKEVFILLNTTEAEAFRVDEVAQKVEARLPSNKNLIKRGIPEENRLFSFDDLLSVTFNYTSFVKVSSKINNVVMNNELKAKVSNKKILRSSFTIKKSVLQKAIRYAEHVGKSSYKQKIPTALIYAIIESESGFNPMARSHVPAYGLMQIVPRSAGKDATKHLYGKAMILSPSFLYSTKNNIDVGSAYLYVLYYKYLSKVKNPQSRIYCTIAAYNTGASNVARAFIKKKNFNQAVKHINKMTSDQVYQTLAKRSTFRETRRYVKKVSKNMKKYL